MLSIADIFYMFYLLFFLIPISFLGNVYMFVYVRRSVGDIQIWMASNYFKYYINANKQTNGKLEINKKSNGLWLGH